MIWWRVCQTATQNLKVSVRKTEQAHHAVTAVSEMNNMQLCVCAAGQSAGAPAAGEASRTRSNPGHLCNITYI